MARLGQKRIRTLASFLCGDDETQPFEYKRHADLDVFFAAHQGPPAIWDEPAGGSRPTRATAFLSSCNQTPAGESGLPVAIEAVLGAILDVGEFESVEKRSEAIELVRTLLDGYHVTVDLDFAGRVQLRSTAVERRQGLLDAELHNAFGEVLHESDLEVARVHYVNARKQMEAGDFANSVKESVCSVEACLIALTGESDFKKALRRATAAGLPKPLDQIIEKLYAWRGNEPGVAHAGDTVPAVFEADAQFARNMAAAINLYLRKRLVDDEEGGEIIVISDGRKGLP